jgi:hypothetical protein
LLDHQRRSSYGDRFVPQLAEDDPGVGGSAVHSASFHDALQRVHQEITCLWSADADDHQAGV